MDGLRQFLKSLLKIHPDATVMLENVTHHHHNHHHLTDYVHELEQVIEDVNLVQENPVTVLKTCFALGVALMFCSLMYTLLLYAHDFVVVKLTHWRVSYTSNKLYPSDLLPVIKADELNLGMKPHRVQRTNEPFEMCVVKNQCQTTPIMPSPLKPVEKEHSPPPIFPHHASISEAIRRQEEKQVAEVASKTEATSDNLPLVTAVKNENLLSMQIIETKCQDSEKLSLDRRASEKEVEPGKAVDTTINVCTKIGEKEKETPKPAQQTESTSSSLSVMTIPTSSKTISNLSTPSNPATNFETVTSRPIKSSTTCLSNKPSFTKRLSPRQSTKKTTSSPEKRRGEEEAMRKYSTSDSDLSNFNWSQESIDGLMLSDLHKNSYKKKFVTPRRQGAGTDEVTASIKEDRGKDDTSEERSVKQLPTTRRRASKPNKDTNEKNSAIALVQMWPSTSLQAGCIHCQNQPLYPVTFRWHDTNPTSVFVSGSFVNWESKIPLRRDRYGWAIEIQLPRGHFEYKYIVDHQWAIDEKRQAVVNTREGQINHVVHV